MIKNIIFDFGDIFINLDKQAPFREMSKFGFTVLTPRMDTLCKNYERGLVSSQSFLAEMQVIFPKATLEQIKQAWNSIILDFPEYRLEFIEQLHAQKKYRLFLLSNTNDLHIEQVQANMGIERYKRFKASFEVFYLSQQIKMRKPDADIYEYVLQENQLVPEETFFIDDTKENTDSADKLGIKCWNLQIGAEDIVELMQHIR